MAFRIDAGPQHTTTTIDAVVDDEEVVVSREAVLVDQMATPLLPFRADFVAAFYETGEGLLACLSFRGNDGVMVLSNV